MTPVGLDRGPVLTHPPRSGLIPAEPAPISDRDIAEVKRLCEGTGCPNALAIRSV